MKNKFWWGYLLGTLACVAGLMVEGAYNQWDKDVRARLVEINEKYCSKPIKAQDLKYDYQSYRKGYYEYIYWFPTESGFKKPIRIHSTNTIDKVVKKDSEVRIEAVWSWGGIWLNIVSVDDCLINEEN